MEPSAARPAASTAQQNLYLRLAPPRMLDALLEESQIVELDRGAGGVFSEGDGFAYFPLDCVLVAERALPDGKSAFIRFFGPRNLVGVRDRTPLRDLDIGYRVVGAGRALRAPVERFWGLFERVPAHKQAMDMLLAVWTRIAIANGACTAAHPVTQRLVRILLQARDAFGDGRPITLTHADLGGFLAVRRETVTEILGELAAEGCVEGGRGAVSILDAARLAARGCACYAEGVAAEKEVLASLVRIVEQA